jgi:hypothetical protein
MAVASARSACSSGHIEGLPAAARDDYLISKLVEGFSQAEADSGTPPVMRMVFPLMFMLPPEPRVKGQDQNGK